jgi:hypothetical protein
MYYLAVVGYETENERGVTKLQKVKYVIQAESIEEANIVLAKYRAGDVRDSESLSITKMPIECVLDGKNTPEYYK